MDTLTQRLNRHACVIQATAHPVPKVRPEYATGVQWAPPSVTRAAIRNLKSLVWFSVSLCAAVALCAPPQAEAEYAAINAKVSLADGSQLQGVPRLASLSLVTAFGKQDIPLALVAALDFTKEGAKVRFRNRDVLSGKLENASLEIKTIFNDVRLDFAQIKSVQFSAQRGGGRVMNEPGLLLHALLDSDSEDLGIFDARLEARNVRIIEGRDGSNAMLLDTEAAKVIIDLPFVPYTMPEGTVEFWAKMPQPHQRFSHGGGQPWFFNVDCPELNYYNSFAFGFAGNDGIGKGGLTGRIHGVGSAGTHPFGAVSTVAETRLLGDTPDGWHHYAFIWKRDGVDFPDARGKVLVFTVDGKVVASADAPQGFLDNRETDGKKNRLLIHDRDSDCTRPVAMSDLRVWDHARLPDIQWGD